MTHYHIIRINNCVALSCLRNENIKVVFRIQAWNPEYRHGTQNTGMEPRKLWKRKTTVYRLKLGLITVQKYI